MNRLEKETLLAEKIERIPLDSWSYIDNSHPGDEAPSDNYICTKDSEWKHLVVEFHFENRLLFIYPVENLTNKSREMYFSGIENDEIKDRLTKHAYCVLSYIREKEERREKKLSETRREESEKTKDKSIDYLLGI